MINYDYNQEGKGQISVQKDPLKNDVVISRLLIKKARLDDSGNYTCSPSNAEPASSYVHVLQGKFIFPYTPFFVLFGFLNISIYSQKYENYDASSV